MIRFASIPVRAEEALKRNDQVEKSPARRLEAYTSTALRQFFNE